MVRGADVVSRPRRAQRFNVLAALGAVSRRLIRVTNHASINAGSACALLRQVAATGLRRPITLVLDNARYQKCAPVRSPARSLRIELLYLPSYSPNLHRIERVWRFVKAECLGGRCRERYEDFTGAIDDCLDNLDGPHKHPMASLLTLNSQTFEDVSVLAG